MGLLTLEHSTLVHRADIALYGIGALAMAAFVLEGAPSAYRPVAACWAVVGWVAWSAIEYALHRFVLHGVQPFRRWHEAHHQRPSAPIGAPTALSATLIAVLVTVPAWTLGGLWFACALTLGVLCGYLGYALTHHATHHWRADGAWLAERKRWHALHHHGRQRRCYGVTSALWDRVFDSAEGSARRPA